MGFFYSGSRRQPRSRGIRAAADRSPADEARHDAAIGHDAERFLHDDPFFPGEKAGAGEASDIADNAPHGRNLRAAPRSASKRRMANRLGFSLRTGCSRQNPGGLRSIGTQFAMPEASGNPQFIFLLLRPRSVGRDADGASAAFADERRREDEVHLRRDGGEALSTGSISTCWPAVGR